MEEKIINIINEMADYLSVPQLQKLQEVILRELAENAIKKEEISNDDYIVFF